VDFSLVRAWVNLEQQVAFLDQRTFGKGYLVDLTRYAWADFNGFRCFEATGELVPFIDGLLKYLGYRDLSSGWRGCRCGSALAAGADYNQCQRRKGIAQMIE
jgi:hypothetical protein